MNTSASMTRNGQPSDPLRRRSMETRFDPHRMTLVPPHHKRVIYVDQFAISDIVKAVNVQARAHKSRLVLANSVRDVGAGLQTAARCMPVLSITSRRVPCL